jgi:hypothetical protein
MALAKVVHTQQQQQHQHQQQLCNESYQFQLDQIDRYLHIKAHNRKLLDQNGIPTVALYSSHTFDGISNINNYYLQGNNYHSNFANGSGNINSNNTLRNGKQNMRVSSNNSPMNANSNMNMNMHMGISSKRSGQSQLPLHLQLQMQMQMQMQNSANNNYLSGQRRNNKSFNGYGNQEFQTNSLNGNIYNNNGLYQQQQQQQQYQLHPQHFGNGNGNGNTQDSNLLESFLFQQLAQQTESSVSSPLSAIPASLNYDASSRSVTPNKDMPVTAGLSGSGYSYTSSLYDNNNDVIIREPTAVPSFLSNCTAGPAPQIANPTSRSSKLDMLPTLNLGATMATATAVTSTTENKDTTAASTPDGITRTNSSHTSLGSSIPSLLTHRDTSTSVISEVLESTSVSPIIENDDNNSKQTVLVDPLESVWKRSRELSSNFPDPMGIFTKFDSKTEDVLNSNREKLEKNGFYDTYFS